MSYYGNMRSVGDKPLFQCSLLLRLLSTASDDEDEDEDASQVPTFFLAGACFVSDLPGRSALLLKSIHCSLISSQLSF